MKLSEHLKLAVRNKYLIGIITVFSILSSYFFYQQQNKLNLENNLFLSISIQNRQAPSAAISAYENLQAADQITESIQGWLISPGMTSEINQNSGLNFNLKAKKQEKNNLLISFSSDSQENSSKYSNQILQSIQKRLEQYNQQSDVKINLAFSELKTDQRKNNSQLFLLIGAVIGLQISYIFALLAELSHRRLVKISTISDIFQKTPIDTYKNLADLHKHQHYFGQLISNKLQGQNLQIFNQTRKKKFALELISKNTNYHQISVLHFPQDIEQIKTNKPTLIIAELGQTKIGNLERIKQLELQHLEIIILEKLS